MLVYINLVILNIHMNGSYNHPVVWACWAPTGNIWSIVKYLCSDGKCVLHFPIGLKMKVMEIKKNKTCETKDRIKRWKTQKHPCEKTSSSRRKKLRGNYQWINLIMWRKFFTLFFYLRLIFLSVYKTFP